MSQGLPEFSPDIFGQFLASVVDFEVCRLLLFLSQSAENFTVKAKKCFKVDFINVQFTLQPVSKHDQEDPEYMKATAEVEKTKTEQEVMKAQVSKTQAETSKTKAEVGKTKAETDKTSADAGAIRSGKKQKTSA